MYMKKEGKKNSKRYVLKSRRLCEQDKLNAYRSTS